MKAANNDQEYQEYNQRQYKKLALDIENYRKAQIGLPDKDYVDHYRDLDKYGLRSTEWKLGPLENPEHDFIKPLLV